MEDLGFTKIIGHRTIDKMCGDTIYIYSRFQGSDTGFVEPTVPTVYPGIKIVTKAILEMYSPPADLLWTMEFKDADGRTIGYYSRDNNILWLSDVTHREGTAVPALALILAHVEAVQRS